MAPGISCTGVMARPYRHLLRKNNENWPKQLADLGLGYKELEALAYWHIMNNGLLLDYC